MDLSGDEMRGYPKGRLNKHDYESLLRIPEYAERAKSDLKKLTSIDDAKVMMEIGTEHSPKSVEIDNPMPAWKLAGFKDRSELLSLL